MYFSTIVSPLASPISVPRLRHASTRRVTRLAPLFAVKEVFMPALSSTMTEGKIVSWLKTEGDRVSRGEALVVVESDKADMDVESFNDGYLGKIVVDEGGTANVGDPIAFIADTEAEIAAARSRLGNSETNGATAPTPAIKETAPVEEELSLLVQLESESMFVKAVEEKKPDPVAAVVPTNAVEVDASPSITKPRADGRVIATPYAKKLAKQMKVDLKSIAGTGPAGRITASDVEKAASGRRSTVTPQPPVVQSAETTPVASATPGPAVAGTSISDLKGTTVPFTALEAAVAKGMIESLSVPEFRISCSIGTDKFDSLYKKLKPKGVTMTALLAKSCGVALAKHPIVFAKCTLCGTGITYSDHVNVAIAVAMEGGGLITPTLIDADSKDIYSLSREWVDLVKRARVKKLTPAEYASGNFTISNLGMYGVDSFDAILPAGTSGILAVGASQSRVVATADGMIGVRKCMTVNLTCDHRIVYGAQAAEFLQTLRSVIENPGQLTM